MSGRHGRLSIAEFDMEHMGHPLIRLVYVSKPRADLSLVDVHDILDVAQKRNRDEAITGVLSFGPSYFLQALEGSEMRVMRLLGGITQDDRHSDLRVVYSEPVAKRMFPHWSMAYIPKPMLFEILRSSGLTLDWFEAEDQILAWNQPVAESALRLVSVEPPANVIRHNHRI
nr:BLUF domain-containing protein [Oceanococcus sp. HetDA_MAG_MS8]